MCTGECCFLWSISEARLTGKKARIAKENLEIVPAIHLLATST